MNSNSHRSRDSRICSPPGLLPSSPSQPGREPTVSPLSPDREPTESPFAPIREPTESPLLPVREPTESPLSPAQALPTRSPLNDLPAGDDDNRSAQGGSEMDSSLSGDTRTQDQDGLGGSGSSTLVGSPSPLVVVPFSPLMASSASPMSAFSSSSMGSGTQDRNQDQGQDQDQDAADTATVGLGTPITSNESTPKDPAAGGSSDITSTSSPDPMTQDQDQDQDQPNGIAAEVGLGAPSSSDEPMTTDSPPFAATAPTPEGWGVTPSPSPLHLPTPDRSLAAGTTDSPPFNATAPTPEGWGVMPSPPFSPLTPDRSPTEESSASSSSSEDSTTQDQPVASPSSPAPVATRTNGAFHGEYVSTVKLVVLGAPGVGKTACESSPQLLTGSSLRARGG